MEKTEDEIIEGAFPLIEMFAKDYWKRAGCVSDYCIQIPFDGEVAVFGGVNRVQWTIHGGFHVLKECCSPNFLEANKVFL